ncbi:hypothetical protein Ancab_030039, partial [Ancistrocladus abbreviatus]
MEKIPVSSTHNGYATVNHVKHTLDYIILLLIRTTPSIPKEHGATRNGYGDPN